MDDELGRAAVLLDQSKRALFDMFNEARMGCAVEVRDAMPMVESIAASVLRNSGALSGRAGRARCHCWMRERCRVGLAGH
jgi:hypothetical protein